MSRNREHIEIQIEKLMDETAGYDQQPSIIIRMGSEQTTHATAAASGALKRVQTGNLLTSAREMLPRRKSKPRRRGRSSRARTSAAGDTVGSMKKHRAGMLQKAMGTAEFKRSQGHLKKDYAGINRRCCGVRKAL